jgi:uncharacterized membrane protein
MFRNQRNHFDESDSTRYNRMTENLESDVTESSKALMQRFGYAGLGIVFTALALTIWNQAGYLSIQSILVESLLLLVGGLYSLFAVTALTNGSEKSTLLLIPAMVSTAVVLFWLWKTMPAFGTDEIAIDYYSAYIFLHGVNPYLPQTTSGVFAAFHVPDYYITPLQNGGTVTALGYPALSFLILLPLSALGVQRPSLVLVFFELGLFLFFIIHYRRQKMGYMIPIVVFSLLAYTEYLFFAAGGVTDIVWVLFTLVGLFFLAEGRAAMGGVFLGLAVSYKQIPIFLLPFIIWFVYRERLGTKKFIIALVGTFVVLNGYFIAAQPQSWLNGVLSPETSPLIGIGVGLSQLSFTGLYFIPPWYFELSLALVFLGCFAVYVHRYDTFKWAFFVFPAIVLLLNFRVLDNYIMYWPLFGIAVLPLLLRHDSMRRNELRTVKPGSAKIGLVMFTIILLSTSLVLGAIIVHNTTAEGITVDKISGLSDPFQIPNYVTEMNVTLSYEGPLQETSVNFRVFTNGSIENANGLLWTALENNTISSGETKSFSIIPLTSVDLLPVHTEFDVVAYSGQSQGNLVDVVQQNSTVLISNPGFAYFDPSSMSFPGWQTSLSDTKSFIEPTFSPNGVALDIVPQGAGVWSSAQISQSIDLNALADLNATLNYNVTSAGSIQSEVSESGWPVQMVGVEFAFNGALQQIWLGYNSSVPSRIYTPNADLVVILSNQSTVSLRFVLQIAREMQWSTNDVQLILVVASQISKSPMAATFSDFTISS